MASLSKKSFIWISTNIVNPTLTLLKDATGLSKTVSIFQSEKQKNYLKSGNRASYSQTKKFQNGSAYEQQSSGSMEVRYAINTSLNFDAGRSRPIYKETFEIKGLNGHYENGNGVYKMSTNFKNEKIVYKNRNGWAIWYDSNLKAWMMTNELIKHPSRQDYEYKLKNGEQDPSKGTYMTEDGNHKGYTPSTYVQNTVVVSLPTDSYYSPVIKVASAFSHTLFLDKSNTLWGVGQNNYKQLGLAKGAEKILPVIISKNDVVDIIATHNHTYAIKSDGSLWIAGYGKRGTLLLDKGIAPYVTRRNNKGYKSNFGHSWTFTKAISGDTNTMTLNVSAFSEYNVYYLLYENKEGIRRKTLYSHGLAKYGQLGDGATYIDMSVTRPEQVTSDTYRNDILFDAGEYYFMYVRQGRLYGFGLNNNSQLGIPTNPESHALGTHFNLAMAAPVNPRPWGNKNVIKVQCGRKHTIVLLEDGTLWAAGYYKDKSFPPPGSNAIQNSEYGRSYKYNSNWSSFSPFLQCSGGHLDGTVKDFSLSYDHQLVLMEDGRLLSSGKNDYGQLGNESNASGHWLPVILDGKPVTTGVTYFHAGEGTTFFVKDDQMYACGYNKNANLGDGSKNPVLRPIKVYPTG